MLSVQHFQPDHVTGRNTAHGPFGGLDRPGTGACSYP